jgi:fluoride exporter
MKTMSKLLLIGLAGFIGTLGRYWLAEAIAKRYGGTFPMGTLIVNLAGCFLVGLLFYLLEERFLVNHTARAAVLIGFLGGLLRFRHSAWKPSACCRMARSGSPY